MRAEISIREIALYDNNKLLYIYIYMLLAEYCASHTVIPTFVFVVYYDVTGK